MRQNDAKCRNFHTSNTKPVASAWLFPRLSGGHERRHRIIAGAGIWNKSLSMMDDGKWAAHAFALTRLRRERSLKFRALVVRQDVPRHVVVQDAQLLSKWESQWHSRICHGPCSPHRVRSASSLTSTVSPAAQITLISLTSSMMLECRAMQGPCRWLQHTNIHETQLAVRINMCLYFNTSFIIWPWLWALQRQSAQGFRSSKPLLRFEGLNGKTELSTTRTHTHASKRKSICSLCLVHPTQQEKQKQPTRCSICSWIRKWKVRNNSPLIAAPIWARAFGQSTPVSHSASKAVQERKIKHVTLDGQEKTSKRQECCNWWPCMATYGH